MPGLRIPTIDSGGTGHALAEDSGLEGPGTEVAEGCSLPVGVVGSSRTRLDGPTKTGESIMKTTSTFLLSAFAATTLLFAPACDDKKSAADKKEDVKDAKQEVKAEQKEAKEEIKEAKEELDEAKAAAEGGGGADAIGVPECDEYVTKYLGCIEEKMPEAAREQSKEAVQKSVEAWKQAAQGPGKESLPKDCKDAMETAKKATESMGCEW
jgi:hypothetical protein